MCVRVAPLLIYFPVFKLQVSRLKEAKILLTHRYRHNIFLFTFKKKINLYSRWHFLLKNYIMIFFFVHNSTIKEREKFVKNEKFLI